MMVRPSWSDGEMKRWSNEVVERSVLQQRGVCETNPDLRSANTHKGGLGTWSCWSCNQETLFPINHSSRCARNREDKGKCRFCFYETSHMGVKKLQCNTGEVAEHTWNCLELLPASSSRMYCRHSLSCHQGSYDDKQGRWGDVSGAAL